MRRGGVRGDADAGGNARAAGYGSGHVAESGTHSHVHPRADAHGDAPADGHGSARATTRYACPDSFVAFTDIYAHADGDSRNHG
ncbi:MAG: hypothetical protein OXN91_10645 [Chloroflexota bacterium]|nr:hypothetical protein [Chloroflexota bacterium]